MKHSSIARAALVVAAGFVSASSAVWADVFSTVPAPETAGYRLVYDLNIPDTAQFNTNAIPYTTDNSAAIAPGSFNRIGYYLELDGGQYAFASMEAFTGFASKTGIPKLGSGAAFQRDVANLNVVSNVSGVVTGDGMTGGNIEFWPSNYSAGNTRPVPGPVPNASGTLFDWGDLANNNGGTANGYGTFQIHNHATGTGLPQTVIAYNRWGNAGGTAGSFSDLGIGSNTVVASGQTNVTPDWTFRQNANTYTVKRLQVVVNSLPMAPGTPPPAQVVTDAPELAGYRHVYTLNMSNGANWNLAGVPYAVDNSALIGSGTFGRVAYYLELQTATGSRQWVEVSMDAFTTDPTKVGVPAIPSAAFFQRRVSNLKVSSNSTSITSGSFAEGNIEFWPSNYTAATSGTVPGGSDTTLDFDDSGASTANGYGSFQIHNFSLKQTILAYNHWGDNLTGQTDIGIGNDPNTTRSQYNPDWTFIGNANTYTLKNLYVFVDTVPEPSCTALIAAAGLLLLRRRRGAVAC